MKPEELRIGNYVKDRYDLTQPILVESLDKKGINIYPGDDGKPYGMHSCQIEYEFLLSEVYGIIINKEWPEKLGFEDIGLLRFKREIWSIVFMSDGTIYFQLGGQNLVAIKFVHQLQNLYFTLTGEELEIKCDATKE